MRFTLCLLVTSLWTQAQPAANLNLIGNGTLDDAKDVAEWSQWFSPGKAEGEATWRTRGDGGAMHVAVRKCESKSAVQIYRGPFPVAGGAWYTIAFEARVEVAASIRIAFMRNDPPYGSLGLSADLKLGPTWRQFAFLVQASKTVENGRLDLFLPVGEFDLDNVVVRALPGEPPQAKVQSVRLGRGVNGKGEHLVDGELGTRVWLGGYPAMPAFVTMDLGRDTPIGRVTVQSKDRGRHLAMGRMECEVSRDGQDWRHWAVFGKTVGEEESGGRRTELAASGGGVLARYVRLRVVSIKNTAPLREANVFMTAAADPAAIRDLPVVPPSSLLSFQGWDYQRNGYDLSPGERLALRFANQSTVAVHTALSWRLETYAGELLAQGRAPVAVQAGAIADVPVPVPANLKDGHHRVRYEFADAEGSQAFHFDHRRAVAGTGIPKLRLGAYLDTQDPEGWVYLSAGPLAKHLEVQRRLGAGPRPDALLVAAEGWTAKDERVDEVRAYVQQGGLALCYGKITATFNDLLPVVIDHAKPRLDALVTLDGRDLGLTGTALRQRGVRVTAKPQATVLASWSDGTPAVVQGTFGKGRVVYVGAGLGRAWTQEELGQAPADRLAFPLLYDLVHGKTAGQAVQRLLADAQGDWLSQGLDTLSVGRFGWNVGEGGLVENISDTARLACPTSRDTWGPQLPSRDVARGIPESLNWLAKRIRWLDKAGQELFKTTVSIGAPCMLWETGSKEVEIECGSDFVVYDVAGKTAILKAGDSLPGSKLAAGWLVLPSANPKERDAPRYLQFARRPASLHLKDGILRVQFAGECGTFWTGRLFGLRRFAPGTTAKWAAEGVPDEVRQQARRLARLCLAFPNGVEEDGEQVENEAFWRVRNRFSYRTTRDEFGTEPLIMAPVPPVFALVHAHAPKLARIANGSVQDLGVGTKYGPWVGVPGEQLVYEISQVADEHYGVVPVKGQEQVQDLIDFHGRQALKVSAKAPSGLVSGGASFLADLREYMGCSRFKPPVSAPCLDLYKWWYCFPAVAGRPAYSPEARQEIDGHYRQVFRDTLDLYPHKTIIRYRREPWTGKDYTVSFIWPVVWRDGVRFFVDQNESSAVIAYCLWTYAQYFGDWDTVRANWHLARWLWAYLPRVNDWGLMCSSNQEYFSTAGIDMLNSEYPGNLAMARMAKVVGDQDAEHLARHLAAKSSIPAVARFLLPAYVKTLTAQGDPWRQSKYFWSMHEHGLTGSKSVIMRGDTWSILQLGIGMYDTSKGTGPEITALYKAFVPKLVDAYERDLAAAEKKHGENVGWSHLMSRAFLGWPKQELAATARRSFEKKGSLGWQSTKYPHNLAAMAAAGSGFHLLEWQPAAYVSGEHDPTTQTVTLNLENHDGKPVTLRAHAGFAVVATAAENGRVLDWHDDPKTGVWTARVQAKGPFQVLLRLGKTRRNTPCIYRPQAK